MIKLKRLKLINKPLVSSFGTTFSKVLVDVLIFFFIEIERLKADLEIGFMSEAFILKGMKGDTVTLLTP